MVNFQALSFFWLKRISEQEEEGKGFFWEINLIEQKWIKKKKKIGGSYVEQNSIS